MSMAVNTLLIELGVEELPPGALANLAFALRDGLVKGLDEAKVPHGTAYAFASPRRLAVRIKALADKQPDREIEKRGPALAAAFKDGQPTKAAEGFARTCGVAVDELIHLESDKGTWLGYRERQQGDAIETLLPTIANTAINALPVPKNMRWGASRIEFLRPVHWLVLLYGDQVVPASLLGLESGRTTQGHRFHAPAPIELTHADDYESALENAYVVVDLKRRQERIRKQVLAEAKIHDAQAVIADDLLEEVNGLVEWPVALTGSFDERFLDVPAECLISSMKTNQKYFHLLDIDGKLKPQFIMLANIDSDDPQQVIYGNEKVIRPRLADAAFFFENDRKQTLEARRESLASVVFQHELGSLANKAARSEVVAHFIASKIGGDSQAAARAAQLAKCDLVTEMVLEFPELQGIMGTYYARHDGESEAVAEAIHEQYLPRFANDEIPNTLTGMAIALADRLDNLTGIFGIGQRPSGTKDPFALRRAAISVLNILIKGELDLDLRELLELATSQHQALTKADGLVDEVMIYMLDRFRAWAQDEGFPVNVYLSVRARPVTRPLEFARRLRAVHRFSQREEALSLAVANKRVSNILAKHQYDADTKVNEALLSEEAEIALASAVADCRGQVAPLLHQANYAQALDILATLRAPVDRFFDEVMVAVKDDAARTNRLALLASLRALFLEIADISELQQ